MIGQDEVQWLGPRDSPRRKLRSVVEQDAVAMQAQRNRAFAYSDKFEMVSESKR